MGPIKKNHPKLSTMQLLYVYIGNCFLSPKDTEVQMVLNDKGEFRHKTKHPYRFGFWGRFSRVMSRERDREFIRAHAQRFWDPKMNKARLFCSQVYVCILLVSIESLRNLGSLCILFTSNCFPFGWVVIFPLTQMMRN